MAEKGQLLVGWKNIASHLRVCRVTAIKYRNHWGLPVTYIARRPVTTPQMIEDWMTLAMEIEQREQNPRQTSIVKHLPFSTA